jgi:alpha-ketoglutarate-dependent taurine dioxygenase
VLDRQVAYWKQQLAGAPAAMELPTTRPRPAVQTYHGAQQSRPLPRSLTEQLRSLSRQEGATLFMTLLAGFQTLLHRSTGQTDIVVGTDVASRNRTEIEGLIGFFVNHLVLRTDLSGNPSFRALLARVREVALEAYAHQDLPFDKLVEALNPKRDLSHAPLFQVLFVFQNVPTHGLEFSGLAVSPEEFEVSTSKYDLALFIKETDQDLIGTWIYKTDLFDGATVARLARQFGTLLESMVASPDAALNALEMLSESEKEQKTMEERERQESKLSMLRNARRKTVDLSKLNAIRTGPLRPGESLPLVLQPESSELDLIDWARSNSELIEEKLLTHGALLFRGFNTASLAAFEQFALSLYPELFGEYGDLPRAGIGGKIYTSTPYPPDQAILFHNESSHMHRWPMRIWFFCMQAAQEGGETPIVDCRKAYQLLDPAIRERFAEKKVMYVRNYTEDLDVSWQSFFQTTDRAVVEEYCRGASIQYEWKSGNGLRTRQMRKAVTTHPKTGEPIFFNQVQLHHVACLDPAVREALLSVFREEDLPRHVYYGDGSPIEDSVMAEVGEVYRRCTVSFPWQESDILMLDNMLVAHGRFPYVGPRKIVVAMAQMIGQEDVS